MGELVNKAVTPVDHHQEDMEAVRATIVSRFQDSSASLSWNKVVEMFQNRNATQLQRNSVKVFQDRNVKMFQGNNVKLFQDRNVRMFPWSNARLCKSKSAEMFRDNSAEMFRDKSVLSSVRIYSGVKFVITISNIFFAIFVFLLLLTKSLPLAEK